MDASEHLEWFVGDLEDPWVAAIGEAFPRSVKRVTCAGPLSATLLAGPEIPVKLALHRGLLTPRDADSLARFRAQTPAPRVVLCVGPHIRHVELERWGALGLFDEVVPEATARDTIARRLSGGEVPRCTRPPGTRPRVSVVSTNFEMRQTLADVCEAAGFMPEPARDWSGASGAGLALWDVPTLEPEWPRQLAERARLGPVVALLGFPDRALVAEARTQGAAACLELPCDLADLVSVLDRLSLVRTETAHAVPPPPTVLARRRASRVAERGEGA